MIENIRVDGVWVQLEKPDSGRARRGIYWGVSLLLTLALWLVLKAVNL